MYAANRYFVAVAAVAGATASAASLGDVNHLVFLMQENRGFDHYYGTMAGVRGFGDPNVPISDNNLTTFQQPINPPQNGAEWLTPYYINYPGGYYQNATQCMVAGSNGYIAMHGAYANGKYNNWTEADTPFSLAYFKRQDIPTLWDIVEGFTVMDMYHQSIMAPTDPNRVTWLSGSINVPGSPTNPHGDGGAMLDNTVDFGCDIEEPIKANCFPFTWKTVPEYLEDAGVSWQLYQDLDNFEDNPLAYFEQYLFAANDSALKRKGDSYLGLQAFYDAAASGTLPEVSYIIGPAELSEHPPNRPVDGAWFQQQVVEAVMNSPKYSETVLIINYDEQGGLYDHVPPFVAPEGTPGEWLQDPYLEFGYIPVGPGPRVTSLIVSPFTRGGNVFTEYSDHTSAILFTEEWAKAKGYKGVYSKEITQWRRDHMSNFVNAFDFENPDYSKPNITPSPPIPMIPVEPSDYSGNVSTLGSNSGPYAEPSSCLSEYPDNQAPVPYGPENAFQNMSLLVEEGFKQVRGRLTEGRYLTFEAFNLALTNVNGKFVGVTPATATHENIRQRWILHSTTTDTVTSNTFYIQSALDKTYIGKSPVPGALTANVKEAQEFTITYTPNGATYTLSLSDKPSTFISLLGDIAWEVAGAVHYKVFSVSYH